MKYASVGISCAGITRLNVALHNTCYSPRIALTCTATVVQQASKPTQYVIHRHACEHTRKYTPTPTAYSQVKRITLTQKIKLHNREGAHPAAITKYLFKRPVCSSLFIANVRSPPPRSRCTPKTACITQQLCTQSERFNLHCVGALICGCLQMGAYMHVATHTHAHAHTQTETHDAAGVA